MADDLRERIHRVVADVFGIPRESVTAEMSPDTLPSWDSLSHINLVVALEAECGISLSPEDAMEMLSVGLIETILVERSAQSSR